MKTAKEMFEELGYRSIETEVNKFYITYHNNTLNCTISFYPLPETYSIHSKYALPKEIHLAINQQMKELGWIE